MLSRSAKNAFAAGAAAAGLPGIAHATAPAGTPEYTPADPSEIGILATPRRNQMAHPATAEVCCVFGDPRSGGRTHEGYDYVASIGDPIGASCKGTVVRAERNDVGTCGRHVKIEHNAGYTTTYCHMNSVEVSVGQFVNQADRIGTIGMTGNAAGTVPHVHWETRLNGTPKNLNDYIPRGARTTKGSAIGFNFGGGLVCNNN